MPPAHRTRAVIGSQNIQSSKSLKNLIPAYTLSKNHKIQPLVFHAQIHPKSIFGQAASKEGFIEVSAGNLSVAIEVGPNKISRPGVGLNHSFSIGIVANLFFVLEDSKGFIPKEAIV